MLRALMSPSDAPDCLAPAGLPLHTRTLQLELIQDDAVTLRAEGLILDLRKCGAVPTGGELQSAGFIHQMSWRAWVDDPSGRIARLEIAQPFVAMERNAATGGECRRDPAPRLQALVGSAFDAGFAKRLAGVFGGPLGCSHLLTLGHALGAFVPRVLARADRSPSEREAGERVARQTLMIDGFQRDDGAIALAIQAAEYELAPRRAARDVFARAARLRELRERGEVALADVRLLAIGAAARERSDGAVGSGAWRELDAAVAPLAGGSALRGMAARVRERVAALPPGDESALLGEALLNFAPALIQCMPALTHRLPSLYAARSPGAAPAAAGDPPPAIALAGGLADSCYMWRSGSPASRARIS